mgnify:CR=1 FL=1
MPAQPTLRGTGDLGVVVERANGSLQIIESATRTALARVEGLGPDGDYRITNPNLEGDAS